VCRSVASFSMEGFRLSTAFRPSWKKLNRRRIISAKYSSSQHRSPTEKDLLLCAQKNDKTDTNTGAKGLHNLHVSLALCVEVLYEVLQQVHPFLDLDLVDFEEILCADWIQIRVGRSDRVQAERKAALSAVYASSQTDSLLWSYIETLQSGNLFFSFQGKTR